MLARRQFKLFSFIRFLTDKDNLSTADLVELRMTTNLIRNMCISEQKLIHLVLMRGKLPSHRLLYCYSIVTLFFMEQDFDKVLGVN